MKINPFRRLGKSTTKQKGDRLEKEVEQIFKNLGKWNVKRNVVLKDSNGNRSQIDVVYGIFFKRYIECKNYHKGHKVSLEEISKFKEVLLLNKIHPSRGIFITSSDFLPRSKTIGIQTINGSQLHFMKSSSKIIRYFRYIFNFGALVGCAAVYYDLESRRQAYYFLERKYQDISMWISKIRRRFNI